MPRKTPCPTPASKLRRSRAGVLAAASVIGLSVAILALTALRYHPRWHSVTAKREPGKAAIVMDCPDDWVVTDSPGVTNSPTRPSPFTSTLALKPRPLTGFPLWWKKYALRQSEASEDSGFLYAYALRDQPEPQSAKPRTRAEADQILGGFEYGQRHGLPSGTAAAIRRVENPLGPALEAEYEISLPLRTLNTGGNGGASVSWHTHVIYIVPMLPPPNDSVLIVGVHVPAGEYAAREAGIKRMLRSVRFTPK